MTPKPTKSLEETITELLKGTGRYNVFDDEEKQREEKTDECPYCGAMIEPGDLIYHCRRNLDDKHPRM